MNLINIKKQITNTAIALAIASGFLSSTLYAKSYQIVEQDMVEEMMGKKDDFMRNAKKFADKEKNRLENLAGQPTIKAKKSYVYYIDPTFTLDRDVPKYNRYGQYEGVLYKKGTQVNPVKFMKVTPPEMVVYNPCDAEEKMFIEKLRKLRYKNSHFLSVATNCKSKELMKDNLGKQSFMLTQEIKNKFKIKETVSIISVDKTTNKIKVEVYNAKENR